MWYVNALLVMLSVTAVHSILTWLWVVADFATKRKEHLTRHMRTRHASLESQAPPNAPNTPPNTTTVKTQPHVEMELQEQGGGR
jgi:hypothetical protein